MYNTTHITDNFAQKPIIGASGIPSTKKEEKPITFPICPVVVSGDSISNLASQLPYLQLLLLRKAKYKSRI